MNKDTCLIYEGEFYKVEWYFVFTGKKIIVTNAYHKKSDKLPPNEKSTALKNMAAYKKAVDEKNKNGKGE